MPIMTVPFRVRDHLEEMGTFNAVEAEAEGTTICLRFELDTPGVVGWQIYDPATGAFLFEGEWKHAGAPKVDLRVVLPEEDGCYRVQVAPVAARERFILIDAQVSQGKVDMS